MKNCARCAGLLIQEWDPDQRIWMDKCSLCGGRPAWGKPAPDEPEKPNGKYDRTGPKFVCKCGRPKVAWRSRCVKCFERQETYHRTKAKEEKARQKLAAKKAFA